MPGSVLKVAAVVVTPVCVMTAELMLAVQAGVAGGVSPVVLQQHCKCWWCSTRPGALGDVLHVHRMQDGGGGSSPSAACRSPEVRLTLGLGNQKRVPRR